MTVGNARAWVISLGLLFGLAAPVSAASISLAWQSSTDPVRGYMVRYGTQPGGPYTSGSVDAGTATTTVVNNLTDGTQYYFVVQAYDQFGQFSASSNEVTALIGVTQPSQLVADMSLTASGQYLDVAFDSTTRRYLAVFVVSNTPRGVLLDLWGSVIGSSFVLAPSGETIGRGTATRVAGGGGRFLVAWNDPDTNTRVARFVTPGTPVTFGPRLVLGSLAAATDVSVAGEDRIGNDVEYAQQHDEFIAVWQSGDQSWIRSVNPNGTMGGTVALTDAPGTPGCGFGRPEIAYDGVHDRALAVGGRDAANCSSGGGAWSRLISYAGGLFTPLESAALISPDSLPQGQARVAFNPANGRFLAVWGRTHTDGMMTFGQRVRDYTGGTAPFTEFQVGNASDPHGTEARGYRRPNLAFDSSSGRFLVTTTGGAGTDGVVRVFYQSAPGTGDAVATQQTLLSAVEATWTAIAPNPLGGHFLVVHQSATGLKASLVGTVNRARITSVSGASSVSPGTSITWTASTTGGIGPLEYQFWKYNGAAWTMVRDFGSSNSFTWLPGQPDQGDYTMQVWARSGGAFNPDDWKSMPLHVGVQPLTNITLTGGTPTTITLGQSLNWGSVASGGNGTPEYQFWVYNMDSPQWTVGRAYGSSGSWQWTPAQAGHYVVQVWGRTVGAADMQVWAGSAVITVNGPPPVTLTGLSVNRTSPSMAGTAITWTATATGGTTALEYQFWRYNMTAGSWSVARAYGSSNAFTWTPTGADVGSYVIQVWVRQTGKSVDYESWLGSGQMDIQDTLPVISNLTASRTFPARVGLSTTFTTTASGNGTLEYQYYVFNGTTWTIGRAYSTTRTWSWTPSVAGTYTIQVWVRRVGSSASQEAWRNFGPVTITP